LISYKLKIGVIKMFEEKEFLVKGSKLGYVSEKEVGTTGVPIDAVIDCYNMDFFPDYDKRRNPYDIDLSVITELTSAFPNITFTGYVLHNYTKKTFIDYQGNEKECYICVLTKSGSDTLIFSKGYYCPANTSQNYYGTTQGFNSNWVWINERHTDDKFTLSFSSGTGLFYFRSTDAYLITLPNNYFKGFFIYNKVSGNVIGIVTGSSVSGGTLTLDFDLEDGTKLGHINPLLPDAYINDSGVVRFPVNQFNKDIWNDIVSVNINAETPNVVRFACGDESRVLWLGMIKNRNWFDSLTYSDLTFSGTNASAKWITAVNGNYQGESPDTFYVRCVDVDFLNKSHLQWKRGGGSWNELNSSVASNPAYYSQEQLNDGFDAGLDLGISVHVEFKNDPPTHLATDDVATIPIVKNTNAINWDGFWFGYDSPEILNKKSYSVSRDTDELTPTNWNIEKSTIGNELGIWYNCQKVARAEAYAYNDRAYSLCIELDGFQTVFVRQILSNDKHEQLIWGRLEKWFDRRITATLLFYDEFNDINPKTITDGVLPLTYLVDGICPGYLPISKMNASLKDHLDNEINSYSFSISNVEGYVAVNGQNITKLKQHSDGLSLNSYLNQEYWKNITMKCDGLVKVGETLIAYGVSQDIVDIDTNTGEIPKVGKNSICTAQVQGNGVNTHSIMSSERITERTREKIINTVATIENNFLILTSENCYWYNFYESNGTTDFKNNTIQKKGDYKTKGITNKKALAKAVFIDNSPLGTTSYEFGKLNFGGVFWAGYETIYGFFDNEPIDLLRGRWRKEYREISKSDKELVSAEYYPNMKDVWFNIPGTGYIFIFSVENKYWKKYLFLDLPEYNIYYDSLGQIMWHDATTIRRMKADWDDITTGNNYKDNASGTQASIPFLIKKKLNFGDVNFFKLFHKIDLYYNVETTQSGDVNNEAKIAVKLTDNNSPNGNVLNSIHSIQSSGTSEFKKRIPVAKRISANYFTVELSSESGTLNNIVSLKINETVYSAKNTGRGLSSKN
jgi:hypothetical protein